MDERCLVQARAPAELPLGLKLSGTCASNQRPSSHLVMKPQLDQGMKGLWRSSASVLKSLES